VLPALKQREKAWHSAKNPWLFRFVQTREFTAAYNHLDTIRQNVQSKNKTVTGCKILLLSDCEYDIMELLKYPFYNRGTV
jgi:hypothetical protein